MIYDSGFSINEIRLDKKLLFLAGSIDLELPGDWRKSVTEKLSLKFNFFNPTTINHKSLTEKEWETHIEWELKAMERSDVILMKFLEEAKSPISLVELGLNTLNKKLVVVCPEKFYKRQYIASLCKYYSTPIFNDLESAVNYIEMNLD